LPQISVAKFRAVPLRVHTFLAGVPLHDAWAIDLPPAESPVTLAEFNPLEGRRSARLSTPARALFRLRFFLGRIFGLEDEPEEAATASFAKRLTPEDRERSLVAPGTSSGPFRVIYCFENESLVELHNRTAHAAALSALVRTADGYRYYFAVYVANASWITPFYMALIDPFRRWFVYPALLKNVRANWLEYISSGKTEG
jgi:hypothetical protein